MEKKTSDILVIIVAYNSMRWAERCYNSLRESSVDCDVMTVDNGSTDGTQSFIRTNFPEVSLVETGTNLGFGRANNIGLQTAIDEGYEYVYLLNQDAWLEKDTLEKLIKVSRSNPDYGILSPMQLRSDKEHMDVNFGRCIVGVNQCYEPLLVDDMYFNRLKDVYSVDFVMAAHWLITRKCLLAVGGFSPTFYHYGEDDNYIHRALYKHFKAGIVPSARAIHDRYGRIRSKEGERYLGIYVTKLKSYSNPLIKIQPVWYLAIKDLARALLHRDMASLKYLWRLYKERNIIRTNLKISMNPCAFLNLHNYDTVSCE